MLSTWLLRNVKITQNKRKKKQKNISSTCKKPGGEKKERTQLSSLSDGVISCVWTSKMHYSIKKVMVYHRVLKGYDEVSWYINPKKNNGIP